MNVGDVVGRWKIVRICENRSIDGHKLFDAQCILCGFHKYNVLLRILKENNNSCNHFVRYCHWDNVRLMKIYSSMVRRCHEKNDKRFRFYGDIGVTVCDEWLNDRQKFNDWAIANGYTDKLTIDRINPDKGYSPENCRWITAKENSKWKSTTHFITVDGITDSGRGWSRKLGLAINYINRYIRKNGMNNCIKFIREELKHDSS